MSTEQNKAAERRIFAELNKGNLAVVDELFAREYVYHVPGGIEVKGPEGFKQVMTMFSAAFPDFHMTIEDMIAEKDTVVTRWTISGTHKGDYAGIPATGKHVKVEGVLIARFVDGKEVEAWDFFDRLSQYQQLGVAPPLGQAGT